MKEQKLSDLHPDKERMFQKALNKKSDKFQQMQAKYEKKLGQKYADEIARDFLEITSDLAEVADKYFAEELEKRLLEERIKSKKAIRKWILLILIVIAGAMGIAWLVDHYNLDESAIVIGVLVALASAVLDFIFSLKNIGGYSRRKGERVIEGLQHIGKELVVTYTKRPLLHLLTILAIMVSIGGLIAKSNMFEFTQKILEDDILISQGTEEEDQETAAESISKEMLLMLTGGDEELITIMTQADVTYGQRTLVLNLSESDRDMVFFQNNPSIQDWEDQDQINIAVLNTVREYCALKEDNIFDKPEEEGGAPEEVRGEVSDASEKEKTADSYMEVKEILNVRESVYLKYPKHSLAQLAANGYQKLALMLVYYDGVDSTVIYYYGKSIQYNFECLKYAGIPNDGIKDRLMIIAQRYTDICFLYPDHELAQIAEKLAEAFRYAADQY